MSDSMTDDKAELVTHFMDRAKQLEDEREPWVREWEAITRLVAPRRSIFMDAKGKTQRIGGDVYDGTAIAALNLFANGLMGYFISSTYPWFKTQLPWEEATNLPGVREWLDQVERVIYDDFHNSNFYEETVEVLRDAGAIGTACLYMEEDEARDVPTFRSIHPKEFFIDENKYGQIDVLYRRSWPDVRSTVERFGLESCSTRVKQLYHQGQLSERIEILHAVEPRKDRDQTRLDSKNKRFASVYIEWATRKLLRESGYDTFPYHVLRLSTNSDEKYGRGPGNEALVDVQRMNRMARDMLTLSHRAADPPLNVPEEMRNRTEMRPGGHNYYSRPDMTVTPIQLGGEFPFALDREQHLQARIEEHFMVDFFLMLQRVGMSKMTATEVMERQAEKAAVLGTMVGRIASDFLDPVISSMFVAALKAQRIPAPPEVLRAWMINNGKSKANLRIEYIGPLAQAQRKFHVTQGTMQALNVTLPYAQFKPEILDLYNWDEIVRDIALAQGMPARLLLEAEEIAMIREARMQAMQEQKEMMQQQAGAEAYGKMKDAPQQGSPVEGIGAMLAQAIGGGGGAG